MTDLLKAEFYKLSRSRSFWGITLFSLLLGSILLLDSTAITDGLVNASLFNTAAYQAAGLLILGLPLVIHLVLGILTGNGSWIVLAQFFLTLPCYLLL